MKEYTWSDYRNARATLGGPIHTSDHDSLRMHLVEDAWSGLMKDPAVREVEHRAGKLGLPTDHQIEDHLVFERGIAADAVGDLALAKVAALLRPTRTGRRRKEEKDSADLVIAALTLHHGYQNGNVANDEPATNRSLAEMWNRGGKPGKRKLADNALTRFLNNKGGMKKYQVACRNGKILGLLADWNREGLSHLAGLRPNEASPNDLPAGKRRLKPASR